MAALVSETSGCTDGSKNTLTDLRKQWDCYKCLAVRIQCVNAAVWFYLKWIEPISGFEQLNSINVKRARPLKYHGTRHYSIKQQHNMKAAKLRQYIACRHYNQPAYVKPVYVYSFVWSCKWLVVPSMRQSINQNAIARSSKSFSHDEAASWFQFCAEIFHWWIRYTSADLDLAS